MLARGRYGAITPSQSTEKAKQLRSSEIDETV